jgi:SOS-response transcriptional repressor LexA
MTTSPATARQLEVLNAIRVLTDENGRPPCLVELGAKLGMRSTLSVRRHLSILERKGLLKRRRRGKPRDLYVRQEPEQQAA